MTAPQQQYVDTGNILLAQGPALLQTGTLNVPGAPQKGVLTIRTESTTLTVIMEAGEMKTWAKTLSVLADSLSGLTAAATAMDVASFGAPPGAPGNGERRT